MLKKLARFIVRVAKRIYPYAPIEPIEFISTSDIADEIVNRHNIGIVLLANYTQTEGDNANLFFRYSLKNSIYDFPVIVETFINRIRIKNSVGRYLLDDDMGINLRVKINDIRRTPREDSE